MENILSFAGIMFLTMGSVSIRVAQQLNVTRGYFVRAFFTSYVFTAFIGLLIIFVIKSFL